MASTSRQVRSLSQLYRPARRPFLVSVRGHTFRTVYRADNLFAALVLVRAIRRGWPHARIAVRRPGTTVPAGGRRAA
jgi:hypothetical protein